MKKVLILTAGFGDGHNTAARNVADALELISDEVKVEVLDVFQSSLGLVNDVLKKAYLGLTRFAPGVGTGFIRCLTTPRRWKAICSPSAISRAPWTHPGPIPARLRPLHLPGLCPCHPRDLPRPFRTALSLHHGGDRFHLRQFLLVPRPQRLVLRGRRGHGRRAAQNTPSRGQNQSLRLSGQPDFRRNKGGPPPPGTAGRPSRFFTSSTPEKRSAARPLTACWKSRAPFDRHRRAATRN